MNYYDNGNDNDKRGRETGDSVKTMTAIVKYPVQ